MAEHLQLWLQKLRLQIPPLAVGLIEKLHLDSPWRVGIAALSTLLAAPFTLFAYRRYLSPLRSIPGPFWASVTRLWHIRVILRGDQNLELIRLHDQYGQFVRIAPNEVSVSHPEAIKKLLLTTLPKGSWYKIVHFPDARFRNPMGATDPREKNELSKHLAAGYTLTNLLQAEPALDATVAQLLDWLDRFSAEHKPVDLDQFLTFTANDVVGEVIFSRAFGFLASGTDVGGTVTNSLAHNAYVAVGGYFRWLHVLLIANPFVTWLNVLPFGHIQDTAKAAIEERKKNPDARFDAVSHWLKYLRENPDRMHPREIQSAAANATAAGGDTTACALQAFVYFMLRKPGAWARARAEVDAVSGSWQRVVPYSDAQRMPFLQACVKEALRVFPPAPMGLPRVAPKGGIEIGGRRFPAGTTLSTNVWVMHHSKEIWGGDAREFVPERWFREDAERLEKGYFIPVSSLCCDGRRREADMMTVWRGLHVVPRPAPCTHRTV
jgi:cytochrome P450